MSIAGISGGVDAAAERLQEAVRSIYAEETTEDTEHWGAKTVPDFRDHDGVRLLNFGLLIDPICACENCTLRNAHEVVDKLLVFERGLIRGEAGSGSGEEITRWFLENHERPMVTPRVPAHVRDQAPEKQRDQLRVRHVFGVLAP